MMIDYDSNADAERALAKLKMIPIMLCFEFA
jgi:hypothetical protein